MESWERGEVWLKMVMVRMKSVFDGWDLFED